MISYTDTGLGSSAAGLFIAEHLDELHSLAPGRHYELSFGPELAIFPCGRPRERFFIDLLSRSRLRRLQHSSRGSEALLRSVACHGKVAGLRVDDASAGLGRDSLLLHSAGAGVRMYERHILIWALLCDALARAAQDARYAMLPHGLPQLCACASCTAPLFSDAERPDVIYYDPMYPAHRSRALVRREMQIFRQVVGSDADQQEILEQLRCRARLKVVVKRPRAAPPLGRGVSYVVEGGQCRFDCYRC